MATQKKNWIAAATSNSHGQFATKAKKAGMSTAAFASKKKKGKGVTAKQAQLAANLMKMSKNRKKAGSEKESAKEDKMAGEEKD